MARDCKDRVELIRSEMLGRATGNSVVSVTWPVGRSVCFAAKAGAYLIDLAMSFYELSQTGVFAEANNQ